MDNETTLSATAIELFHKVREAYVHEECPSAERWTFDGAAADANSIKELLAHGDIEHREVPGYSKAYGLTRRGERLILASLFPLPTHGQRFMIDLVADHQVMQKEPLPKIVLYKRLEEKTRGSSPGANPTIEPLTHDAPEAIEEAYLNPVDRYPKCRYELTTLGWLASKYRGRIIALAGGMLRFFRQRYEEEKFDPFTWDELRSGGFFGDETDREFVQKLLWLLGLSGGGADDGWTLPADDELRRLLKCADGVEFVQNKWFDSVRSYLAFQVMRHRNSEWSVPLPLWWDNPLESLFEPNNVGVREAPMGIMVFVSHASKDAALAKAFVDALEACVELPDGAILCTSVDGHGLEPGAVSDEVLRDNLEQCSVVVGLLTKESIKSGYVIMELGAAWGLRKTTCAIVVPSVGFEEMPGPLKRLNAIRAVHEPGVAGVMQTIAQKAGTRMRQNQPKIQAGVAAFVAAAKATS